MASPPLAPLEDMPAQDQPCDLRLFLRNSALTTGAFFALYYYFQRRHGRLLTRLKLSPSDVRLWNSKSVSLLHSLLSSASGAYITMFEGQASRHIIKATSPWLFKVLPLDVGFYVFDSLFDIYGKLKFGEKLPVSIVLHHVIVLATCAGVSVTSKGSFITACMMMTNVSTFIMHTRWMLIKAGVFKGKIETCVNGLFATAFFCTRVAVVPYFLEVYRRQHNMNSITEIPEEIPLKCTVGTVAIFALNLYWCAMIVSKGLSGKKRGISAKKTE